MLDGLPEQIEPSRLAEIGRSFQGTLALANLTRLVPLLARVDDELKVSLRLYVDERRLKVVEGRIQGEVWLRCQRCLQEMCYPLDIPFRLGVALNEADAECLPAGYDPLLVNGDPIRTVDIFEDEVLLELPPIPVHTGEQSCETGYHNREFEEDRDNPFAVLEKLKSR